MGLPNGIAPKTREQWMALASSTDPVPRKEVTDCLRALGLASPDYMPMDAATRVDYIMDKQGPPEGAETQTASAGKGSKKANTAAATSSGGGGLDAESKALLQENNALLRKIHDLLVVQIFTDPQVKANAEDMDVKVELLGNA